MSILIDLLPVEVEIEGIKYEINSSFRTSLLFLSLMEDAEVDNVEKIQLALELYYPIVPKNINKAIEKIKWFYKCGKDIKQSKSKSTSNKNNEKILDYEEDADYIYSAFMSQYNIDLQDIEYLHWWKFQSLFNGLKDDNKICEIMKYRSIDISKIKDKEQKKFYKDMKNLYKLDQKISNEDLLELEELSKEWK